MRDALDVLSAMLSPKTQTNLKNAQGYFEEHLSVGDYYAEGERVRGEWLGQGAASLGLSGAVTRDAFLALCENLHPDTGKRLTQRQNNVRASAGEAESEVANRRVFYDFTFSPPKSVSIAALVSEDERIVEAHGAAVKVAFAELERFAAARIRGAGRDADRRTGNIVAALFEHETSRALDPHLHTHCIVFNATHDSEEGRWKALQNYEILAAQKYAENVYYHELARSLRACGYTIKNTARGDFEIAEVEPELCARFSKRHREIDEKTRAFLKAHPDKRGRNEQAIREHIAHKDRAPKVRNPSAETLRSLWRGQLSTEERETLRPARPTARSGSPELSTAAAVTWAEEHLFERRSVVREHELWRHALAAGRGSAFAVADIHREAASRTYLHGEGDKLAHRDALAREWAIVEAARDGIGRLGPLAPPPRPDAQLAPDQSSALDSILGSTSFITLFRGGAGTGKSFVLQRVQRALDESGRPSVVLAPQRQQVIDLGRDGLRQVKTVSEVLQRDDLPSGAVVIVDEAGQIGGRQLLDLIRMVEARGGRLILSGDTRQHGPVEASDALRAIERYSGVRAAELNEIRRQDPARGSDAEEREKIAKYREAVEAAAEGDLNGSLEKLETLGAVVECSANEQCERLSEAYVRLVGTGESAIVVSQTRAEVRSLNEVIRARLRGVGALDGADAEVIALETVDLSAAQKRDARHYPDGSVLVFNRDFRESARGEQGRLVGVSASGLALEVGGSLRRIPFSHLDKLTVCRTNSLALCGGDKLQLKANGCSEEGRKLANGEVVTVAALKSNGAIRLEDGRTLPPTYRQFQRGYAVTSYGSQGKTVDHVLFGDSSVRAASNAQQWYVTISRGRKSIQIFTPDKEHLRRAITRSGDRELALDLVPHPKQSARVRNQLLRGVKRGRELARRLCKAAMRNWFITFLKTTSNHHRHETPPRTNQTHRSAASNVLAT